MTELHETVSIAAYQQISTNRLVLVVANKNTLLSYLSLSLAFDDPNKIKPNEKRLHEEAKS